MLRWVGFLVAALLLRAAPLAAQAAETDSSARSPSVLAAVTPGEESQASCTLLDTATGRALLRSASAHPDESYDTLLRLLRLADRAARCAADDALLGDALNALSNVLIAAGRYNDAYASGVESVAVHERLNDRPGLAEAWNRVGNAEFWRSHHDAALDALHHALEISTDAGDLVGQGRAWNNLALVHKNRGQLEEALGYQLKALEVFERLDDRPRMAVVVNNVALNYFLRGDYQTALDYNQRALELNRELDALPQVATSLDSRGNVYRALGLYRQALASFDESLALRIKLGDVTGRRETTHNIGLVHFSQGDYEAAIAAYKRGLALNRAEDDRSLSAEALRNIGAAAWRLGQPLRARANFEASLAIARNEGLRLIEGEVLNDLGEMARAQGRLSASTALFDAALRVRNAIPDHAGLAESWTSLAATALAAGRYEAALAAAERALQTTVTLDQPELRWRALTMAGAADRALGRRDHARRRLAEAVDAVERLSAQASPAASLERRFFEDKVSPYQQLIALDIDEHRPEAALELADRSKARVLAQLIRQGRTASPPRTPRADTGGATWSLAAVTPDRSTAILEYALTDTRLFIFVVTSEDGVLRTRVETVLTTPEAIVAQARTFRDAVAARDFSAGTRARAMFRLLLSPVEPWLTGCSNLLIVPDGALWEVPFQALLGPNGYVIEQYAISYVPSLSVLQRLTPPNPAGPGTVLAVGKNDFSDSSTPGLSPLHDAEAQAVQLREIYGRDRTRILLGDDATEQNVRDALAGASIVHLATHGVLDDAAPLSSHLALTRGRLSPGDDGRLEAWEMARLRLSASLVVLAACDTARGRVASGEGVVGSMWALLAAGARSVVVSQFVVEEHSAASVLLAFHKAVASGRGSLAERLRHAQLAILRNPRTAHPYYWAAFILAGDGA